MPTLTWVPALARPDLLAGRMPSAVTGVVPPMAPFRRGVLVEGTNDWFAQDPDGLPIEMRFKTRVRHIYYGPGCNWNMTDWKQDSTE